MGIYRAKKALGVIDRVFKLMIYLGRARTSLGREEVM
jgi:hypothetical protein